MMQTAYTGFSVSVINLWLLISFALAKAEQKMEGNTTTSQKSVRDSQFLCPGEQEYVHKRKQVVLESLSSLGINCSEDSVPHITLLASGGGQRAAVGMVGSLYQMAKEDMLDTVLYLGGVSGSTWSMATIYSDPEWSTNMDAAVSQLSGPGVDLKEALAWLGERAKEEHFSLSDIWGVLTSAGVMKQMDLRLLSDEASRNATNPYPIYSAIEMHCFSNGPIQGKWFEVSPHEAGFTELDVFVETSLLGSKFQRGELLEQKPEMDMVRLQGILGCALADEDTVKDQLNGILGGALADEDTVKDQLNVPGLVDGSAEEYMRVYIALVTLVAMTRSTIKDPAALSNLDTLQKILEETFSGSKSAWLETKTPEERIHLAQQLSLKLLSGVQTWSQSLEEGDFKTHVSLLTSQVIPKLMKWEWGTTANFLYQYQDSKVPPCLSTKEKINLVDAGLLINVGYPPFLGDKRDIDLIIAPEYSAGNMFETLIFARDYAAEMNKSFPEIDDKVLEEREWPKDCYVFEGKETELSIVYMPLFNRKNCKDAEQVKARMEEFTTFQRPFSQDKIEFVLETAKTNMKNNKHILLREIKKAVLRRQNKRKCLLEPPRCAFL